MTRYQQRMRRYVNAAIAYIFGGLIFLLVFPFGGIGWFVYLSVIAVLWLFTLGCDSVYDSLSEEIANIQLATPPAGDSNAW